MFPPPIFVPLMSMTVSSGLKSRETSLYFLLTWMISWTVGSASSCSTVCGLISLPMQAMMV